MIVAAGAHPAALLEIRLASIEMLPHLALRPAPIDAGLSTRRIAAATNQGASASASAEVDIAMSETPAKWRTPASSFWR